MWKTLRILCVSLIVLMGCSDQSEVTAEKTHPLITTTSFLDHAPPTHPQSTTTTTTTPPPTTTTTFQASTSQVASSSDDIWDRMCSCECGGVCNWANNSYHDGGLQFHPDTWTDYVAADKPYGLVGYPVHAYEASREQQIMVAIRVRDGVKGSSDPYLNPQGWNAWPTCRHEIGV